jgi:uncharacterized protein (TIGR03000 family)
MLRRSLSRLAVPVLALAGLLATAGTSQAWFWNYGGYAPYYWGGYYGSYWGGYYPYYGGYSYYGYPGYAAPWYSYYPAAAPTYVAPVAASRPAPAATDTAAIEVRVPANAEVSFQGVAMAQRGSVRQFVSPPLAQGQDYSYEVRAHWQDNGREVNETRRVQVRAGGRSTVDFLTPAPTATTTGAETLMPPARD